MLQWYWRGKTNLCWWMSACKLPFQNGGFSPGLITPGSCNSCESQTFAHFLLDYFERRKMKKPLCSTIILLQLDRWYRFWNPVWSWMNCFMEWINCMVLPQFSHVLGRVEIIEILLSPLKTDREHLMKVLSSGKVFSTVIQFKINVNCSNFSLESEWSQGFKATSVVKTLPRWCLNVCMMTHSNW